MQNIGCLAAIGDELSAERHLKEFFSLFILQASTIHTELVVHQPRNFRILLLDACRTINHCKFLQFLPRRFIVNLCDLDTTKTVFQLHLLTQERIPCRNGFEFGIRENGLVHILQRTQWASARHDLSDLLLLVLDRLP